MKYCATVIAVRDMEKSLQFYKDLFQQDVLVDLGKNKTLTCGLALQQGLEHIAGFDASTMKFRSNTMELYFETEDFDEFMQLLNSYPQVERLHEPKTFSWLQRGIHIFDPDGHLIEVSESMYSVACKQFKAGKNIEETAQLVQHPLEVVRGWYEQYKKELISVCGTDCRACYCFGKMCNGCNSCEGKVFHASEGKVCPIYDCVINNKCMPTLVPCWQLGTLGLVAQSLDEYMKPTNTWMTMVWISVKICFPGQTSCRQNAESNLNDMPLFGAVAYVGVPTMERLQCI